MAMRIYSQEEFDAELRARNCEKHDTETDLHHFWYVKGGHNFSVPHFPDGQYPDFILDDIIRKNGLPPKKVH